MIHARPLGIFQFCCRCCCCCFVVVVVVVVVCVCVRARVGKGGIQLIVETLVMMEGSAPEVLTCCVDGKYKLYRFLAGCAECSSLNVCTFADDAIVLAGQSFRSPDVPANHQAPHVLAHSCCKDTQTAGWYCHFKQCCSDRGFTSHISVVWLPPYMRQSLMVLLVPSCLVVVTAIVYT